MSLTASYTQGFAKLEKEGADFIKYVLKKTNTPFEFDKQTDFEQILDMLERYLKIKSKCNGDTQLFLYKVMHIKKLLKKLHESLTDIERNASEDEIKKILKAMRAEVSFDEIKAINIEKLPKGVFYNYDEIRKVLLRKLNGEIDDKFFKIWLVLICNILNEDKLDFISNYFDACSFLDQYNTKEVLEMLATLKDFNYKLINKDFIFKHKKDKLKVIYLRFLHFNRSSNSKIFKAYFVNYKTKRFDVRIIDDEQFDYRDDLMYCDIWSKHFDDDGDYFYQNEEYDFEPAELKEEVELMNMFYNEEWVYDHELNF